MHIHDERILFARVVVLRKHEPSLYALATIHPVIVVRGSPRWLDVGVQRRDLLPHCNRSRPEFRRSAERLPNHSSRCAVARKRMWPDELISAPGLLNRACQIDGAEAGHAVVVLV